MIFGLYATHDSIIRYQPEQVHLSLGGKLNVIIIKLLTWTTVKYV